MRFIKKLDKRLFNLAAWMTIILTYILPYKSRDGFATNFGWPFEFFTVYDKPINKTIIMSTLTNPLALLLDILVVYCVLYIIKKLKITLDARKNSI